MPCQRENSLDTFSYTVTATSPTRLSPATVSLSLASILSEKAELNHKRYTKKKGNVFCSLYYSLSLHLPSVSSSLSLSPSLSRVVVTRPLALVYVVPTSV